MAKREHILEVTKLRNRVGIFAGRKEAGLVLAELIRSLDLQHPLILAVPAGGVPVAAPLAESLACQLDVAVVSKITLPWNSEAGYGAVAFDSCYLLNESMIRAVGLGKNEIAQGIETTRAKVLSRLERLRKGRPMPDLTESDVVVVDDGLASGFTMQVAVAALRRTGAKNIIVAVPTGHESAVNHLANMVEMICCANIRSGPSFAVASAYLHWDDVSELEAEQILSSFFRL